MSINWSKLSEPFSADEIEWRVGNKSKRGDRATLLAYLTSRAVQERLDQVVGPHRWRDSYTPLLDGAKTVGFLCTLEIEVSPGVWIGKTDISDTTAVEALKGGVSGALKRAAVKWGIGRYLYGLDSRYHEIREGYPPPGSNAIPCPLGEKGNTKPGHIVPPQLPSWALPEGSGRSQASRPERREEPRRQRDRREEPRKQSAADDYVDRQVDRGAGPDPRPSKPQSDRAGRLRARIERIERTMQAALVAEVRRRHGIPADSDLLNLTEETLVAYGKDLAVAAKAAA